MCSPSPARRKPQRSPNLSKGHRGASDLVDRRDQLQRSMTGVRLYVRDALTLAANGIDVCTFVRAAVAEKLRRDFPGNTDSGVAN